MKLPDYSHPDWVDERLEAFLDGTLPPDEHAAVARVLAGDADGQDDLFLARRIRDTLRAWPEPSCPPHVTEAVLAQTRRAARDDRRDRVQAALRARWTMLWQPALAMAVLLLVVWTATLVGRPPEPSRAEVEQALAEVQWTLAYLSEVGRQTGRAVRQDVLSERVVSPVQDAFNARHSPRNDRQSR